jgi:hypothetical protein
MILLTPDLRGRLLANGRKRNVDHVPVVEPAGLQLLEDFRIGNNGAIILRTYGEV